MDLLKKYNISFENKDLIMQALTHTSYANEHNTLSYERLDAVNIYLIVQIKVKVK